MNLLLTGAGGFIGKNLLASDLPKKYKIFAPSRQELDLMDEAAVTDFFTRNEIDVVIHGAGKPAHRNAKDPSNIFYADMRMFLNLLQNSRRYKRMIVLSSGAVYDQRFEIKQAKEGDYKFYLPTDEHALYRRVAADYIERSENIVELRVFGIFGPYEDYAIRFISNAICKTLFDLPITLKQNRKFDYLFVKDLAPILEYFIENKAKHKAYNITSGQPLELLQIASVVKEISGKDLPIKVAKTGMGLEYTGDNSRLKNQIKSPHFTPIGEAIKKLHAWYKNNSGLINRQVLLVDK